MVYPCSVLLRTLPAIDHEFDLQDEKPEIIFDLPRPKRDWPEGSERAFYESMAKRCTTVATSADSDADRASSVPEGTK